MTSMLDQVLTSNPAAAARRPTPEGDYTLVLRSYKEAKNPKNGNEGFELTFGLLEALSGQDLEGVDISRASAYFTLWITEGTISSGITQRILTALGIFEEGVSPRQMLENGVGAVVDGTVTFRKGDVEKGSQYPRLDVERLGTFNNRPTKVAA